MQFAEPDHGMMSCRGRKKLFGSGDVKPALSTSLQLTRDVPNVPKTKLGRMPLLDYKEQKEHKEPFCAQ